MKVKVRKRKSPAPVATEQAIKALSDSEPDFYSAIQKAICSEKKSEFITSDIPVGRPIRRFKDAHLSEPEFIAMIDSIHHAVHHPRIKNAKAKKYPDVKISELAKVFCL